MSTNCGVGGSSAIRGSCDFSHDKLRAVALEMVVGQLHRAVAEAIAVELHNDIDAAAPQLAAHYARHGRTGRRCLPRGGGQSGGGVGPR